MTDKSYTEALNWAKRHSDDCNYLPDTEPSVNYTIMFLILFFVLIIGYWLYITYWKSKPSSLPPASPNTSIINNLRVK